MANTNSQRVAAFLLALLFLLTTVAAAIYVIYELNTESGIVNETTTSTTQPQDTANACGQSQVAAVEPRAIPTTTTADIPVSELEIIDIEEGTGAEVQPGDCVAALYYGTLASDGQFFDGNYETGQPIEFPLTGVIPGWTQGIPGMKEGGVRRLVIPAELAYGEAGSGDTIPPNSDLVFEVQIISTRPNN